MKKTELKRIAAFARVVIKNPAGEILLVHMVKTNEWNFPGGKFEDGEAPEATAAREVKEEVDLDLTDLRLIYDGDVVWESWGMIARGVIFSANADASRAKIMEPAKLTDMRFWPVKDIRQMPRRSVSDTVWMILGRQHD
jgi:ADP-ribose pyrophosphatase YjhB (NUDIX family)